MINKDTNSFATLQVVDPILITLDQIDHMIKESTLDLSKELLAPPTLLTIDGQSVASLGNISVVIGKAKSKKTFFISLYVAAALVTGTFSRLFKSNIDPAKNRVLFIDTEQAKFKVHQVGRKIQRLSGNTGLEFEVLSLRSRQVQERVEIIERKIYGHDDICLVAIDGIRDLLYDINDPASSSELVGKLMKWSEDLGIHIVTVLHQNKGDNNARGHIGTEAVNKAETVISITKEEKNPDLSIVAPEHCREREFAPFAIGIDDEGLPYVSDEWSSQKKPSISGKSPFDFPATTHNKILTEVFANDRKLKLGELKEALKVSLQSFDMPSGDGKVKNFITYYTDKMEWVIKIGKDKSPTSLYSFTGIYIVHGQSGPTI